GSIGENILLPNVAVAGGDGQQFSSSVGQRGSGPGSAGERSPTGSSGTTASTQRGANDRLQQWRTDLQSQLIDEGAFFRDSKAEELSFWQEKLALTEAGSKARFAIENNIYQLEKQLALQNERDALTAVDSDEKVTEAAYAHKKAAIQASAELGKISSR